jgi:hypothetical protein
LAVSTVNLSVYCLLFDAALMPFMFSDDKYVDIVYIKRFYNRSASAAAVEYRQWFPNCRMLGQRVFTRIFNMLDRDGTLSSAHVYLNIKVNKKLLKGKTFFNW